MLKSPLKNILKDFLFGKKWKNFLEDGLWWGSKYSLSWAESARPLATASCRLSSRWVVSATQMEGEPPRRFFWPGCRCSGFRFHDSRMFLPFATSARDSVMKHPKRSKQRQVNTCVQNWGVAFGRVPSLRPVFGCFFAFFDIIVCQIFVSSWHVYTFTANVGKWLVKGK